jgi:CelD/BcsL family acetyltransferase involved in cellulose biosynthesis
MYARPFQLPEPPELAETAAQTGTVYVHVHTLVSLQDIVNAGPAWRSLETTSTAPNCFFQSYAWCKNWIEHHAGDDHQPAIFIVTRQNQTIAILPMMQVTARGGVTLLRPLGEPHTQYAGILTPDGNLDTEAAQVLRQSILNWPGVDAAFVQYVPSNSPLNKLFDETNEIPTLRNEASQFDLGSYATSLAFAKSLPARRRQAQRRAAAALQQDGELTLNVLWPAQPEFADALMQCLQWKDDWITKTGRMNAGLNEKSHGTFLTTVQDQQHLEGVVIFALKAGARTVAYQLGFIHHGHYHLYTASFDWSLRRWSLGTVLIDMTIGWLIDHNVKLFDLLGNPSPYKGNWSNQPIQLSAYIISKTPRGLLYANLWVKFLRPSLKHIYHILPQSIRVQMLRMLGR